MTTVTITTLTSVTNNVTTLTNISTLEDTIGIRKIVCCYLIKQFSLFTEHLNLLHLLSGIFLMLPGLFSPVDIHKLVSLLAYWIQTAVISTEYFIVCVSHLIIIPVSYILLNIEQVCFTSIAQLIQPCVFIDCYLVYWVWRITSSLSG